MTPIRPIRKHLQVDWRFLLFNREGETAEKSYEQKDLVVWGDVGVTFR